MDTPNADRFMRLLNQEYDQLVTEAQKMITEYERELQLYTFTEMQRFYAQKSLELYRKDITYYSRGAENGNTPTANEQAETPKHISKDMCVIGI